MVLFSSRWNWNTCIKRGRFYFLCSHNWGNIFEKTHNSIWTNIMVSILSDTCNMMICICINILKKSITNWYTIINKGALQVQVLHDLPYWNSCDYFFSLLHIVKTIIKMWLCIPNFDHLCQIVSERLMLTFKKSWVLPQPGS